MGLEFLPPMGRMATSSQLPPSNTSSCLHLSWVQGGAQSGISPVLGEHIQSQSMGAVKDLRNGATRRVPWANKQ